MLIASIYASASGDIRDTFGYSSGSRSGGVAGGKFEGGALTFGEDGVGGVDGLGTTRMFSIDAFGGPGGDKLTWDRESSHKRHA